MADFLPLCRADMDERGWQQADFVFILADAYVDHPSFGPAIISRVLEAAGFRVAIISQPDWRDPDSVTVYGRPRLGFLISGGNMDSMVNHYTVAKKHRRQDAYSPGGQMGLRPDHASVVYGNLLRRVYRDAPVILGGVEASLRRTAHYDYWSDSLKRSILLDSQADLLAYGMGERSIVEIAQALDSGLPVSQVTFVNGTAYAARSLESVYDFELLPAFAEMKAEPLAYARSFLRQQQNADPIRGRRLVEPYGEREYVVVNPPAAPLSSRELDAVYELPYARRAHPSYDAKGGVPALAEVKFSLTSCRGCFGSCSFCSLTLHQGRIVQARSHESLLAEARLLAADPEFKGYIHDVGGPTADFRAPACAAQLKRGACAERQCLFPTPCRQVRAEHGDYLRLLRRLRQLPGIKKVFIRSGVRFDYVLADPQGDAFIRELCAHHVSGQLKLAPEHVSPRVLSYMGKPPVQVYEKFCAKYEQVNAELGLEQHVEPYLMSSHPGSTLADAVLLAEWLRDHHSRPEQVQDFYPTPSSLATCMYYTGVDPRDQQPVYVARDPHEKALQRALIQYWLPDNHQLVVEALRRAKRTDLIGFDKNCLVAPRVLKEHTAKAPPKMEKKPDSPTGKAAAKPAGGQRGADRPQSKPGRPAGTGNAGKAAKPLRSAKPAFGAKAAGKKSNTKNTARGRR